MSDREFAVDGSGINALWTDREIKKAMGADCCGYNTGPRRAARRCGHGCGECCEVMSDFFFTVLYVYTIISCFVAIPAIACTIFNIALFTAKDIALLQIAQETGCDGHIQHLAFSLGTWIQIAAIGHMIIVIPILLLAAVTVRLASDRVFGEDWPDEQPDWVPRAIGATLLVPWFACIAWTVIGFVFWDGMQSTQSLCSSAVLSWCVIELIEIVLSPLLFMFWCTAMGWVSVRRIVC